MQILEGCNTYFQNGWWLVNFHCKRSGNFKIAFGLPALFSCFYVFIEPQIYHIKLRESIKEQRINAKIDVTFTEDKKNIACNISFNQCI